MCGRTSTQLDVYNLSGNDYNLIVKMAFHCLFQIETLVMGTIFLLFVNFQNLSQEPEPSLPEPIPEPVKEFKWLLFLFDFDKDVLTDKIHVELDALIYK